MQDPHNILIIGPSPKTGYLGGVATHIRSLLNLSALKGAILYDPGSFHTNRRRSPFSIVAALISLRRMMRYRYYDIVMMNASLYTFSVLKLVLTLALIPKQSSHEIHVFFHGGNAERLRLVSSSLARVVLLPVMKKATRFHFLSTVQKEGFERLFARCATALFSNYAATDTVLSKTEKTAGAPLRLLFVGRIVEQKGVFELLGATERLQVEYPGRIMLTIVGEGKDLARALKRAESLPAGLVEILGYLEGPALENVYLGSDILVLPSYAEAFPYAVVEAMRAGLPIIATPEGALETLVRDGVTGFQVKPKDIGGLADSIERLLRDRALLNVMSHNCRDYFRNHLSKFAAEKYYVQLVKKTYQAPDSGHLL